LSVYAVPDDDGHRLLLEGLSLLYSSSANHDASLSKLMTTSGSALDVQCRRVAVETSETFLDHCLGELPLRTIRYFCFGVGYLWESLLAEVEVSVAVDDVAVEVLCARPVDTDADNDMHLAKMTFDRIYGGGSAVDGAHVLLAAAGLDDRGEREAAAAAEALYAYRVAMKHLEYDVSHPRTLASFHADDLRAHLVELSVPAAGGGKHAGGTVEAAAAAGWSKKGRNDRADERFQALLWSPE
jgi:hypothetical protein